MLQLPDNIQLFLTLNESLNIPKEKICCNLKR